MSEPIITDAQIEALHEQALRDGDDRTVGACERALDGSRHAYIRLRARVACAAALRDPRYQHVSVLAVRK